MARISGIGTPLTALKRARIGLGLTQQEVAKKVGVSRVTICRWESGDRMPTPDYIRKLSKAVGLSWRRLRPDLSKHLSAAE